MGRYFFDVIHDGQRCADEEGVDCADDRSARAEASRFLAELATRIITAWHGGETGVEVRDARHIVIASIGFALDTGGLGRDDAEEAPARPGGPAGHE